MEIISVQQLKQLAEALGIPCIERDNLITLIGEQETLEYYTIYKQAEVTQCQTKIS